MDTSESTVDSGNEDCSGRSGATVIFERFTEVQSNVSFSSHELRARLVGTSGSGANVIPGEALGAMEIIIER